MKKFLVLSLVLGVVSLASAGLDLGTVDGISYTVDTATRTVTVYSTLSNYGFNLNLLPDSGQVVVTIDSTKYTTLADGGFWGPDYGVEGEGQVVISASNTSSVTGVLLTFTYEEGATEITIYDGNFGSSELFATTGNVSLAGYTIAVPEPATMALLGLGALVLRRKK